jgi:hypothetical protein
MRVLADRLAKDADQLRDTARRVTKAIGGMDASGEWADACDSVVRAWAKQFGNAGTRLDGLAATLRRSATEVEAEIEAERRRQAEVARLAEEARRAAVLRAQKAK